MVAHIGKTVNSATRNPRGKAFWFLQVSGWVFAIYLIYVQGVSALNYDLGVELGLQEPAEEVGQVGVAFWKGFAFADIASYIPLLVIGLFGHFKRKKWGEVLLAAALGISLYWPIVCLKAVVNAQSAPEWQMQIPIVYWIVLPLIMIWSVWGLWILLQENK